MFLRDGTAGRQLADGIAWGKGGDLLNFKALAMVVRDGTAGRQLADGTAWGKGGDY